MKKENKVNYSKLARKLHLKSFNNLVIEAYGYRYGIDIKISNISYNDKKVRVNPFVNIKIGIEKEYKILCALRYKDGEIKQDKSYPCLLDKLQLKRVKEFILKELK